MLRFDAITIFPEFFSSLLRFGVVGRAFTDGVAEFHAHDLRDFTTDRHRTVDDRPFGGGEGMVLKPEPIFRAVESLGVAEKTERDPSRESVVLLSAQGERFTQSVARELSGLERVVLICGRYEGVDERVTQMLCDRELSIGDFVLSGGELAAAVMVDSIVRLLPGVLGNADSSRMESFGTETSALDPEQVSSTLSAGGLLDYPHFTRPVDFRGTAVPEVLTGGDHAAIRRWRRQQALRKTAQNRPDLMESAKLTRDDLRLLQKDL